MPHFFARGLSPLGERSPPRCDGSQRVMRLLWKTSHSEDERKSASPIEFRELDFPPSLHPRPRRSPSPFLLSASDIYSLVGTLLVHTPSSSLQHAIPSSVVSLLSSLLLLLQSTLRILPPFPPLDLLPLTLLPPYRTSPSSIYTSWTRRRNEGRSGCSRLRQVRGSGGSSS